MRLPTFTKCCFCFPLRKGVLCYGYIHLILCTLGTACAIGSKLLIEPAIQIATEVCVVLLMTEAIILIILIKACHKKRIGLLKAPFVYNKVWWVLHVALGVFIVTRMIFMYQEAIATNNGQQLAIVFNIGSYIIPILICNICLRSFVTLWIKGLMIELKEPTPPFDIASVKAHILEVTVEENEERVQIETDADTIQLEDKNKELNTKDGVHVQIKEDEVGTKGNDDKLNANPIDGHVLELPKDNEQDIELQVLN